jgi:peptidoglycan/LPS O-acetylase OafA/YrhL
MCGNLQWFMHTDALSTKQGKRRMRLVALDLIRFFAAIFVVFYHYTYRPNSTDFGYLSYISQYGYLGVPLFFMISGFVIALSAHNRTPVKFAVSRFLRLYPTLWVCVIFTVVVASLLSNANFSTKQILANFTLLNEYLGISDVDGVYWTLKQELKFYFCVFLLLIFNVFNKFRIWITGWILLTAIHAISGQPFFLGWFISPGYSPFFIAGIGFYLLHKEGKSSFTTVVIFSSLVLGVIKAYEQASGFIQSPVFLERLTAPIIVIGFFVTMYAFSLGKLQLEDRRSYVVLGSLTYPLYLIHNVAGNALIDRFSVHLGLVPATMAVTAIMIFSSWIIYELVENRLVSPIKKHIIKKL